MTLLVGSLTIGLIFSLLAFGILITYRVVAFDDLTVDALVGEERHRGVVSRG